jgi:hypothetical protein
MEALKVFPQIFFDAIARVVPGLMAMFLYVHFCGWTRWHQFVEGATGIKGDEGFPVGFVFSSLIAGGYIVGHLISPFTKMIQRLGEVLPEEWWKHKHGGEKERRQKASIVDWQALKSKRTQAKDIKDKASINYDSLRLHCPEVGGLCAKRGCK